MRDRLRIAAVFVVFSSVGYALGALPDAQPRRIELAATKYTFSLSEIRLRRGETTVLVITSPDFPHGFGIPELGIRVDLIPGKDVVVRLKADRPGRFAFLCDNFCGEGHDRMSGFIVVE